ncbi:MAG: thioesterase [Anaerolineales bacterium]|nr:thioesterase [Anaerolineales bacterium]
MSHPVWLPITRTDAKSILRLFCFPYAGGSSTIFHRWGEHLPEWVEVIPAYLPGRGTRIREQAKENVSEIVQGIEPEIKVLIDTPIVLFGHSFGALVAFEIAHLLQSLGQSSALLVVSASRAAHLPPTRSPIHTLEQPDFIAELKQMGGTPDTILENAELMQLLLPTLRTDFKAAETYRYTPGEKLSCPILALASPTDPYVKISQVAAWEQLTSNTFQIEQIPGGHHFLETSRSEVLASLSAALKAHSNN